MWEGRGGEWRGWGMGGGLGPEEAGDDLQEGGGRGTKGTPGGVGWKGEKADEAAL